MRTRNVVLAATPLLAALPAIDAFQCTGRNHCRRTSITALTSRKSDVDDGGSSRRDFFSKGATLAIGGILSGAGLPRTEPASAVVYLDPAMYGDQENRVAAVDSLREAVRRSVLQNPELAPSYYQMAILDGLSYNKETEQGGPDGSVMRLIFNSDKKDTYTNNLKTAAQVLIDASKALKKYTAITIGDAIALAGAQAIESVGGPVMSVQLGRTDPYKMGGKPQQSNVKLDLFSGEVPTSEVGAAFKSAGLTEREMTALLGGLLTLDAVEKSRSPGDWKASQKPKFREPGKLGRMSDFKRLTDEDIEAEMAKDYDDDDEGSELTDDEDWYIAETFGTRDEVFGQKVGDLKGAFNRYLAKLNNVNPSKGKSGKNEFGWIGEVLIDKNSPTTQSWLNRYAGSTLTYEKDLGVAYNAITQLGAEYTGGKYESLLKNRPRKTLADFD